MSSRVRLVPEAWEELEFACMWYEEKARGLGARLLEEVRIALACTATHPFLAPLRHRDLRFVRLNRFPFLAVYRVEPALITVVAIFHARRDRKAFLKR